MRPVLAVLLCACAGTAGDVAVDRATISFKSDGSKLALESAPLQEGYQATYPNPRSHDWVKVEVTSDARLTVACRSERRTECADSPVTVSVEGGRVRVFDVYNVKLADLEYTGRLCGSRGSTTPAMTESMGNDPNVALALEDPGDIEDDDDAAKECPGETPTTSTCPAPEAKLAFCTRLNAGLSENALPPYDCTHLGTNRTFPEPQLDGEIACKRQIVGPAGEATRSQYAGCRDLVRTWENESLAEIRNTGLCGGSPLVLDLDGDGINATTLDHGVTFDLFAARPTRTAWLGGGDGLLVIDRNHNGLIDDGTELFGQSTFAQSHADGFAALARLDSNGDGAVDAHDAAFADLRVWIDADHDGRGPASEWLTLPQAGVGALSTRSHRVDTGAVGDGRGNWLPLRSHFDRTDGTRGQLVDVWFRVE